VFHKQGWADCVHGKGATQERRVKVMQALLGALCGVIKETGSIDDQAYGGGG